MVSLSLINLFFDNLIYVDKLFLVFVSVCVFLKIKYDPMQRMNEAKCGKM